MKSFWAFVMYVMLAYAGRKMKSFWAFAMYVMLVYAGIGVLDYVSLRFGATADRCRKILKKPASYQLMFPGMGTACIDKFGINILHAEPEDISVLKKEMEK